MEAKNISAEIKALRDAVNLSQMTLAVKLGRSMSTVQRYERGESVDLKDLAVMIGWAREAGRSDLSAKLKAVLLGSLDPEVIEIVREKGVENVHREETAAKSAVDHRRKRIA